MRACVLHALGDLRLETRDAPEPGPGEALVRVSAVGICGSDLPRVFVKGTYRFPLVIGHEMAGKVERLGGPSDLVAEGDAVVVFPLLPCGECEWCNRDLRQLCDDYDYLGSRSDGGLAEYLVAPVGNLLPIPEGVPLDWAAMTEPAAVARHALRRGSMGVGDVVWIIGAGPIGLMLTQWALSLGAEAVLLTDVDEPKLALAGRWPCVRTHNPAQSEPVAWVLEQTAGRGADLVIEAVGIEATICQALLGARKRGRVVLMGNPAGEVSLPQSDYWQILRHELHVTGTWNSTYGVGEGDDWRDSLDAMAAGALGLEPLITHRISLDEAPATFRRMHDHEVDYIKVLVKP